MDSFNLDLNFVPDFSYLQELEAAPFNPSVAFGSQPRMSGFSVQTLESPSPAYVSQPDAAQNNDYSVNPLNQFDVAPSTLDSNFISGDNLADIPLDELDRYLGPNETSSDELRDTEPNAPTDISPLLQGESFGKTPANHTCPDIQLTNPTAGIHSSQGLRPVAVVNPLLHQATSDNQATQVEVKVDGSSSLVERQRERYQTDPAYAEGQRIYISTYNRIKNQTSNKEAAKEQAVIARNQYLQSVNLAKNSGDLPLTSNLAETTQSSSKNLDGTAPPPPPPAFQSSN
ncbi:hypothetical protein [Endozoicomonas atrinae]|uniref:hypothetical protein n=1 Tax=Endozoicomonas atrinae TaxID=1333660 RepID=UPI003B00C89D